MLFLRTIYIGQSSSWDQVYILNYKVKVDWWNLHMITGKKLMFLYFYPHEILNMKVQLCMHGIEEHEVHNNNLLI